jgi:hypothetical protein
MKAYGGMDVYIDDFLISVMDGGEWSAWYLCRFIPQTHWIGGLVSPDPVWKLWRYGNSCPTRTRTATPWWSSLWPVAILTELQKLWGIYIILQLTTTPSVACHIKYRMDIIFCTYTTHTLLWKSDLVFIITASSSFEYRWNKIKVLKLKRSSYNASVFPTSLYENELAATKLPLNSRSTPKMKHKTRHHHVVITMCV